jgi:Domain of unknown function (DUF1905)
VTFPFSAVDVFGVRAQVPVKARFDDSVDYTGSLAPYGDWHRLGVATSSLWYTISWYCYGL